MPVSDRVGGGPEVERAAVEDPVERTRDRPAVGGDGRHHEQAHAGQLIDEVFRADPPVGGRDAPQVGSGRGVAAVEQILEGADVFARLVHWITEDTAGMSPIPGVPTTVLVAPDSFKGTLSAAEVAEAIGRGLEDAGRPVGLCPVADGGEGTLDALLDAVGGELRTVPVSDPLGRPIDAAFALGDRVAVVETAAASGLGLVDPSERDPVQA